MDQHCFPIGAFAVIFNERDEVLLAHRRDKDLWNLPGGKVEAGESPWDATIREAREEIGVDIEIRKLAGVYWKPERGELVFSFLCDIIRGAPTTSNEADEVRFFSIDAMPENTSAKQVERIHDVWRERTICVWKTQR